MSPQNLKPKLVFATIAAGGGHVATAEAMREAIERHYPAEFEFEVCDLMKEVGFDRQDTRHKELWRWMLAHPWSARWGQRLTDSFPRVTYLYHRQLLDAFAKVAARVLGEKKPVLIVANHGWLVVALTRAQRHYDLRVAVLTFATEPFDASALWVEPAAEHFVVPSVPVLNDLVRMGVSPSKIDVIGYPVKQAFLTAPNQQEARARLGLPATFSCLVSLGGEGIAAKSTDWLPALLALSVKPTVMVMAGRNAKLKASLAALERRYPNLRVEGFTDQMATFLAASDVVIGKAGPASVMEALALGKPFLATGYAGLNEQKILAFLSARGLGRYIPDAPALLQEINDLAKHPERLERSRTRATTLNFAGMSEALTHYLVAYARAGQAPEKRSHQGGLS